MISRVIVLLLLTLSLGRAKTILCPSCSQSDFENAYYNQSSPGDIIVLPAGSATWGNSSRANAGVIYITTNVTVMGQGTSTIITLDDTGATYANGVIALWSASTFMNMEIVGSNVNDVTAFQISPYGTFTGGFRLTGITYIGGTAQAYFAYVASGVNYGLIDNCQITGNSGSTELIFVRGPTNAWTTTSAFGTANNIFVENCTFNNLGYVCDANSYARMVIRFCTINGQNKIDGHGVASNSPAYSVREIEAYDNQWTATGGVWTAVEIRGGSAVIFDNTSTATTNTAFFFLTDYGYQAQWPNFNNIYQTPYDYPIFEQVGTGNGGAAASQPAYIFNNLKSGAPWPRSFETPQTYTGSTDASGYPVGTTDVHISALGLTLNAGNAVAFAGDNHRYILPGTEFATSLDIVLSSPGLQTAIPAAPTTFTSGAVTLYQQQTGNPNATFGESDVIKANRDFYADAGFDTATGVGRGTTAQMNALTPPFVGYGFWVTDQGSWNATLPANTSGQLYVWSGTAWVLAYTPYTYPHPLRAPVAPSNLILGP